MKKVFSGTKNCRKLLIAILFAFSLACFLVSATFALTSAGSTEVTVDSILSEYTVGSEIDIPKGKISVGTQEYEVYPKIFTPDGKVLEQETLVLDKTGKYTLEYSVEVDSKIYSDTKEFFVYDYLLVNSKTQEPLIYRENETYGVTGAHFSICPEEKVVYNKVIDLNDYSADKSLIILDAVPEEPGKPDARQLYFRLTDAYDENNYITFRLRRYPDGQPNLDYGSFMATHGDYEFRGWGGGTFYIGNDVNWGSGFENGFLGNDYDIYGRPLPPVEVRFDYENKTLYSYHSLTNKLTKIVNFNEDFGVNAWKGFTTGEARLTIWAETYTTTNVLLPFNGVIFEIDGQDLSKGVGEDGSVSLHKITEVNGAEIDFGEYESAKQIPNAMVGFKYKVFDSSVKPIYGDVDSYVRVYYGYGTSTRYEVPVIDGCFVPDNVGVYSIVYTVVDKYGNVNNTNIDVNAIADDVKTLEVTVPDYNLYQSGDIGLQFDLVAIDDIIVSNSLGNAKVTIEAKHVGSGEVVDATCGWFLPEKQGAWEITYTAEDYVGRVGSFTYDANVEISEGVVFGSLSDVPKYLIVNASNPIPNLKYIDYNAGLNEQVVSTIYAKKDGNKVVDITNGYFKPTSAGAYEIVYEATSQKNVTSSYVISINAVDVGFGVSLDMSKYFYSEGIVSSATQDRSVSFIAKENAVVDFIRPVDAVNFAIKFNIGEMGRTSKNLSFVLVDINNLSQMVKVSVSYTNNSTYLDINGENKYKLDGYSYFDDEFNITLSAAGLLTVTATGRKPFSAIVNEYANGEEFNGFESYLLNFSIIPETPFGVEGNTEIIIKSVSGQNFSSSTKDNTLPKVVISESIMSEMLIGETVKIAKSVVVDVFDPYAKATLTVQDANGVALTDKNGKMLKDVDISDDYMLEITSPGKYYILYNVSDSANTTKRPSGIMFEVVSREKPVISVSGGSRTGEVNKACKVGSAKVISLSKECQVYVFVFGPTGNLKSIDANTNTFKPTQAGTHIVRYFVIDEWGNMAISEYKVQIS